MKNLSGDNFDFIKTRIKDTALKSFGDYNTNFLHHLSNEEFEALKILSANCNLYIQKADKSNSVVTIEKRLFNPNKDSLSKKHYFFIQDLQILFLNQDVILTQPKANEKILTH